MTQLDTTTLPPARALTPRPNPYATAQGNATATDVALAAAMPELADLRTVLANRLVGLDAIVTSAGTPANVANVAQAQTAIRQLQQAVGTLATNQRDLAQFVRSLAINQRRLIRKQRGDFTASD